MLYIQMYITFF